jgi:hypothetical protein
VTGRWDRAAPDSPRGPAGPARRGPAAAVERVRLPNGAVVLWCAGPPSRLAALVVAVPLPAASAGAGDLLAALWQHRAAGDGQLAGTRIEPLVTPDCVGLRVEALSARFATGPVPLPPAPGLTGTDEIDALRRSCGARRTAGAFDLLRAALFGAHHPYCLGRRERGEAALSSTDEDLASWTAALALAPPVVAVCGAPRELAERLCAHLDRQAFAPPAALPPVDPPRAAGAPVRLAVPGRRARYLLGTAGAALGAPDKPAVHVAWAVLAGRDGLLDQRLRRERRLTYALAAFSREFARGGYCACAVDCGPTAVEEVREVTTAALLELAGGRVGGADLDRARQRLTVQHHLAGQSCRDVATRACCYEVVGVPAEQVADYPERMTAVTGADVRRAVELFITSARAEIILHPIIDNSASRKNPMTTVFQDVPQSGDF